MKSDKMPVIGLICVMLSCVVVLAVTIGLLASVNKDNAVEGSKVDVPENSLSSESEPELQWGYKFKYVNASVDGGWVGTVAYKSQKSTLSVDEVKLTVSFGSYLSGFGSKSCDVPEFDIYFADPSSYIDVSTYTLKTVEEQFFSEEYYVKYVHDNSDYYHYEYAHTEEIIIPKELFTESEGIIRLVIGGINIAENGPYASGYLILGSADIKYQMKGTDEVVLSKPYDDEWHY